MDRDHLAEFEAMLIGCKCTIQRVELGWFAHVGEVCSIFLSPWRIISHGRIRLADTDDHQVFGLPTPLNAEAEANKLLAGKLTIAAKIHRETADLTLEFESLTRLEIFNMSCGYEGWNAIVSDKTRPMQMFALGGGDVTVFADTQPNEDIGGPWTLHPPQR